MRWFSFILILLAATLLNASSLLNVSAVDGWHIRPSILITLLVFYALSGRSSAAISCSFLIGLGADLSTGLLGPHMLCYGLTGLLLNQMSSLLSMKRATHKALFVFVIFMLTEIGAYWLSILKTGEVRTQIYSVLFFTGLYSGIISPLVWSILSSLSGWSHVKQPRHQRVYH